MLIFIKDEKDDTNIFDNKSTFHVFLDSETGLFYWIIKTEGRWYYFIKSTMTDAPSEGRQKILFEDVNSFTNSIIESIIKQSTPFKEE